ncbi:MAG: hypothetical protein IPP96_11925 [Chitinophagaceae bacterium]|nr:hypothetical protein [Chitinophagaceae bacterium]
MPVYKSKYVFILLSGFIFNLSSCKKNDYSAGASTDITVILKEDLPSTCAEMFLTSKHDNLGRPYLYIAAKDGGLKIFNITTTPSLIKTIAILNFGSLHVMNLSQQGNYLYLALGNHFGTAVQSPGFAIIDVSDPANAFVKSYWTNSSLSGGAGIIETEGNYAYLGAMKNGLMIFDVSDKAAPAFKSSIVPFIFYPDPNPDPAKYNARGMIVKNDIVYLCYDAGGLRIINATDKLNPRQTGKFSNPGMNGKPRAYNNLVLDGSYVYAAVDYCGMEVLNVSDSSNIKLTSWWNPWNCQANALNWFSSNGHANEIAYDAAKKLIFISSGKSDLQVVNVSDPANPVFKFEYGGVNNNMGTWGISIYNNRIYLSYICSVIPFSSNWTGVKILQYN